MYIFIFLAALASTNILLAARIREESRHLGLRPGTLCGLSVTGGVITAAGIVLAATFAALVLEPTVYLTEVGSAVAIGVLLDTLLVRTVLVPAALLTIGERVWWPTRSDHRVASVTAGREPGQGITQATEDQAGRKCREHCVPDLGPPRRRRTGEQSLSRAQQRLGDPGRRLTHTLRTEPDGSFSILALACRRPDNAHPGHADSVDLGCLHRYVRGSVLSVASSGKGQCYRQGLVLHGGQRHRQGHPRGEPGVTRPASWRQTSRPIPRLPPVTSETVLIFRCSGSFPVLRIAFTCPSVANSGGTRAVGSMTGT